MFNQIVEEIQENTLLTVSGNSPHCRHNDSTYLTRLLITQIGQFSFNNPRQKNLCAKGFE